MVQAELVTLLEEWLTGFAPHGYFSSALIFSFPGQFFSKIQTQ